MTVYRITNWAKYYENNRTRELKKMAWVPMPNKFDGDGYTDLVGHENGAAYFGAWCALVEVASRCEERGTLLRNGHLPHDGESLARITRLPAKLWNEVLPRLLSIGWIEKYTIPQEGAELPQEDATAPHPSAMERNGTERNGTECNIAGKKPVADPAVKRLVDTYHDAYFAKTKEKPTVSGRWGRAFKGWLRAHSEEDIRKVIAYFFAYDKRTLFGFDKFQTAFDNLAPAALGHSLRAGSAQKSWICPHCGEDKLNTHTGSRCMRCRRDRDDKEGG